LPFQRYPMLKITFFPLHFLSFFLYISHSGNHFQVRSLSFRSKMYSQKYQQPLSREFANRPFPMYMFSKLILKPRTAVLIMLLMPCPVFGIFGKLYIMELTQAVFRILFGILFFVEVSRI
jgi:hypothetical protein